MTRPYSRAWPVIFLLLVAPLIAEVLWGTTTVTGIAGYFVQIGFYGGAAVVIREVVHRWRGGWPSILLLGAAYGAIEEGLLEPTWFTPQLQSHPYGVAAGVFWVYAAFNIGFHAVFSITIPILLTELVFGQWRDRQWLGMPGTIVAAAVYVVNAAAIGLLWYAVLQESVYHVPGRLHLPQQIFAAAFVVVLIGLARLAATGRRFTPGGPRPPRPWALGLLAGVGALSWFGILWLSSLGGRLDWLPFEVPLVLAAAGVGFAVWSLRRWSERSDLQVLAVCLAALIVQMAAGFAVLGTASVVDVIGKAVLDLAAIGALMLLFRRLQQPTSAPHPSSQPASEAPTASPRASTKNGL